MGHSSIVVNEACFVIVLVSDPSVGEFNHIILMKFKKRINKYLSGNNDIFNYDIDKHLAFLNHLPNPKNLIHRSYLQYKCHSYKRPNILNFSNTIITLVALLPLVLLILLKPRRRVKYFNNNNLPYNAVFIFAGVDNIVSLSLKQKFINYKEVEFGKLWYLNLTDLKYIYKLIPYIASPYFVFKCVYKMAMYRAVIENYGPHSIICSSEYSFTSSFLTWYCEQNKIKHINVMHGEKLLDIKDSFFQFHECYVWDIHYIELFKILRAEESQFIVDIPPCLHIKTDLSKIPDFELTYYLTNETEKELKDINKILHQINILKNKICIRPHPRYSDIIQVKKVFKDFFIENTKEYSIENSINNTRKIASLYSTVLYQGYISGKEIVVDNMSQRNKFKKLVGLKFIVLSKYYETISSLILNNEKIN